MTFWTVAGLVLVIAVPWGVYELADLIYGLGLEHGLTRHTEARIKARLTAGGINVEFERDRIAKQQIARVPDSMLRHHLTVVERWPAPTARRPF